VYSADADGCCFDCLLHVFDDWYTVGTVLVDMWEGYTYTNRHFLLFSLSFDCFWLFLTIGTPRVYQPCTNSVPIVKISQKQSKDDHNSKNDHWCTNRHMSTKTIPAVYQQCTNRQIQSKIVKRQSKQQKWPLVYQSSHVYQDCTSRVPTVYQSSNTIKNSQKTVKTAKMTIGVPIVTWLHMVRQIHKVRVRRIHKAPIGRQ